MKCILKNIEPFDKFWFRSCFYQAFLSIALYYGGDLNKYCANQIFRYRKLEDGHLIVDKVNIVRYDRVEGVREHRRRYEKHFIAAVEDKLKKGYPVIFAADSYYIPYRNDCYLKDHSVHYICIYGFDSKRKRLYVFDHSYWGSYKYEKKEVIYSDFLRAYVEYHKQHPLEFSFYWYSNDGKKEVRSRPSVSDLNLLEEYIEGFKKCIANGDNPSGYRNFFFGETWLRIPVMEMFQSFGKKNSYGILNEFINTARLIWAVLTKYKERVIPQDVRKRLYRYADRFVSLKKELDEAQVMCYDTLSDK